MWCNVKDEEEAVFEGRDDSGGRSIPGGRDEGAFDIEKMRRDDKPCEEDAVLMGRPDVEGCGGEGKEVAIARGGKESMNGVGSVGESVRSRPACGEIAHDLERPGERG